MLLFIDSKMPESEQIKEYITADEIPTSKLKLGDTIISIDSYSGECHKNVVIGFFEQNYFGETKTIPYVNRYGDNYINNCNNHITTKTVRIVKKEN